MIRASCASVIAHKKGTETMRQNTVIHILLGVAVLPAIALFYLLLAPPDQSGLSSSQWVLFAGFAIALMLAAFAPSVLRRLRGLPSPQPLSPSDIRFTIAVATILCTLAFFAVLAFGPFGSLVIMLVPISFHLRFPRWSLRNTNDRITDRVDAVDRKPPGQTWFSK
jgi:hypothetical protein